MLVELSHRGPDDRHSLHTGHVAVGHNRLAIMDPKAGNQPFVDTAGRVAVTNGEIYNYRDLAGAVDAELRTGSDGEVVLPLFRRDGSDLVDHLDGMYAFVVVDDDGRMVAGRDRLGIKPLYVARRGGEVAFASELKALLSTGWSDIATIPPGHIWDDEDLRRYYILPDAGIGGATDEAAVAHWVARLRDVLERSVVKRLMSDVPLGTFLSGGIDSSIVTALAARHIPGISTFALGFEGSADLEAARLVADHLGTNHHEISVPETEPLSVLSEVLYHLESWDRDLVRSALPTYLVARFASRELKVVLTGEGADELFAGYRYHADYVDDPDTLQHELRRSVATMHDSNLQRVDRMTMAHSLEARVPFLDPEVVDVAMQIPAELKLRRGPRGRPMEKWILRHAFADLLPPEIIWRTKTQFDEGSGAVDRLSWLAASAAENRHPDESEAGIRDVEEAWYFSRLESELGDWRAVKANTSVWERGRLVPAA